MSARAKYNAGKGIAPMYVLRMDLCNCDPPIWRRVAVPSDANLGWLHAVIQVAMGWTNCHLHQFELSDGTRAGSPMHFEEEEGLPVLDENAIPLNCVMPRRCMSMGYQYDFGDCWMHTIVVDAILPAHPKTATIAQCVGGARACPPDDCGGIGGFHEMLDILFTPKHPRRKEYLEWLGGEFDPTAFDNAKVNRHLKKLKWPHATEDQLRTVLMARDGYRE